MDLKGILLCKLISIKHNLSLMSPYPPLSTYPKVGAIGSNKCFSESSFNVSGSDLVVITADNAWSAGSLHNY